MTTLSATPTTTLAAPAAGLVDPRGQRLAAGVTAVVLATVLLLGDNSAGVALLAVQTVLFGIGAGLGVQHTPHAWVFRTWVRPRLGPASELEEPAPPRFAQAVGLGFAAVGLLFFLGGLPALALVAVGFALAAALLNAVFGFCLGCEMYLLLRRATAR